MDSFSWQVLTVTLTVAGLVVSGLLWQVRGTASGVRGLAWTLLPAAAYLTGVLRLLWEVGDAAVHWAVHFAFSPFAWLGIVVAGVSATLFVVASAMRRRGVGTRGREPKAVSAGKERPGSSAPARSAQASKPDEDLDEIEAILKRHGIS